MKSTILALAAAALLLPACDNKVQATPAPSGGPGDGTTTAANNSGDSGGTAATEGAVKVDAALPDYAPAQGVSGTIKSVGSDTMNITMSHWLAGFKKHYPNVKSSVEGKGSGTAPPALISGASTFGPMSRAMKSKEVADFEKAFGHKPVQLKTSIDMLAVYVNKDNPIKGLSLKQVDAIFSKTRKGGHGKDIRTWGDLGLTGEWATKPIALYGRNSASGTYGYFKKHALFKGDYKDEVKEQGGSSAVVQGVEKDRYAIGYSGIGFKTAGVRALPLCKSGTAFVTAEPKNAYNGTYPLARFLYLTVNKEPGKALDPLRMEFIKYVFAKPGQEDVVKAGYLPVSAELAAAEVARAK